MNDRLQTVERTVGERLLELRHAQQQQGTAIQGIQETVGRLVGIAERMVELQHQSREQSGAIDRAFAVMKENREELARDLATDRQELRESLSEIAQEFRGWKTAHEAANNTVAETVTSHKTGVKVIWAVFSLVAVLSAAWLAVSMQRLEERIAAGDAATTAALQNHLNSAAATERRYEGRFERLEYRAGDTQGNR